ncbi:MAG: hypothetical protein ABW203_07565 [Novosphingobium sp.]
MSNDQGGGRGPQPDDGKRPAQQTGEGSGGAIKQPQQTDATAAEKNLPRGSEKETHARK